MLAETQVFFFQALIIIVGNTYSLKTRKKCPWDTDAGAAPAWCFSFLSNKVKVMV